MQKVCKQVKRFYRISRRARSFQPRFYELITSYIKRHVLAKRVNWPKFEFEFKTIGRKCKQKGLSAKCYLRAVIRLVIVCLQGNHKQIDSQKIIKQIYES